MKRSILILSVFLLNGCAAAVVVGAAAGVVGAAVNVTATVVETAVDVAGAGIEGAIDLATGGDDAEDDGPAAKAPAPDREDGAELVVTEDTLPED